MVDKTLKNLDDITATTNLADTDIAYTVRPSTNADYKASLGDMKAYFAPSRPQIVATHNAIPSAASPGNASARSDVQNQYRSGHYIGCQDVDQIQIGMIGYYMPQNTNTGTPAIGNSFNYEAAIEITNPALTRNAYFGSSKTTTIEDKSPLVLSSPIGMTIEAGTEIFSRQGFILADPAHKFPDYVRGGPDGANYRSPAATSQIPATGALTLPSGGIGTYCKPPPTVILGVPKNPMVSVLVIGDSIADGVGDSGVGTRNSFGFIRRGLADVNGYSVPWHFQAIAGSEMNGQSQVLAPLNRDMWKYCTHAIMELGFNDIDHGAMLATLQSRALAILTELKRTRGPYGKALKVAVTTITPKTASSNSWTNAAGQTTSGPFVNGGIRDQYNTWLISLLGGGLVDYVIDLRSVTEDPADHTKWATNGTSNFPTGDGTHPYPGMVLLMAPVITAWAQGLKP